MRHESTFRIFTVNIPIFSTYRQNLCENLIKKSSCHRACIGNMVHEPRHPLSVLQVLSWLSWQIPRTYSIWVKIRTVPLFAYLVGHNSGFIVVARPRGSKDVERLGEDVVVNEPRVAREKAHQQNDITPAEENVPDLKTKCTLIRFIPFRIYSRLRQLFEKNFYSSVHRLSRLSEGC